MRFLYAYILCCIIFGMVVIVFEMWKKTYRGKYMVGTLLFPSIVFGNWVHSLHDHPSNSQKYIRLQWMLRIHALLLLASILVPFEYLGAEIARFSQPSIQSNSHVAAGTEVAFDFAFVAIGGLVSVIELVAWFIAYVFLAFFLVIVPRIVRPVQ